MKKLLILTISVFVLSFCSDKDKIVMDNTIWNENQETGHLSNKLENRNYVSKQFQNYLRIAKITKNKSANIEEGYNFSKLLKIQNKNKSRFCYIIPSKNEKQFIVGYTYTEGNIKAFFEVSEIDNGVYLLKNNLGEPIIECFYNTENKNFVISKTYPNNQIQQTKSAQAWCGVRMGVAGVLAASITAPMTFGAFFSLCWYMGDAQFNGL